MISDDDPEFVRWLEDWRRWARREERRARWPWELSRRLNLSSPVQVEPDEEELAQASVVLEPDEYEILEAKVRIEEERQRRRAANARVSATDRCVVCGRSPTTCKQRCRACYQYLYRNGVDRPATYGRPEDLRRRSAYDQDENRRRKGWENLPYWRRKNVDPTS